MSMGRGESSGVFAAKSLRGLGFIAVRASKGLALQQATHACHARVDGLLCYECRHPIPFHGTRRSREWLSELPR